MVPPYRGWPDWVNSSGQSLSAAGVPSWTLLSQPCWAIAIGWGHPKNMTLAQKLWGSKFFLEGGSEQCISMSTQPSSQAKLVIPFPGLGISDLVGVEPGCLDSQSCDMAVGSLQRHGTD